jgi:hypothetical protein
MWRKKRYLYPFCSKAVILLLRGKIKPFLEPDVALRVAVLVVANYKGLGPEGEFEALSLRRNCRLWKYVSVGNVVPTRHDSL